MIISESSESSPSSTINKSHPTLVTIDSRYLLTKAGSSKQTYHIALDIRGSGLSFKVGDSIGIFAQNDPLLVAHLITAMGAQPEDQIADPRSGKTLSLWEFLSFKANLSRITSSFLKLFYTYETAHDKKNQLNRLLQTENKPLLSQFLSTHDPLDLFREFADQRAPLQELCQQFGPLLPRFYSVASSPLAQPHVLDLTVALFTFSHGGEQRYGVASHFLCHLAEPQQTKIPVYIQSTPHFTLPENDEIPLIMIGPGTGVAPYRAFLQERIARNAKGKNWLFFGERNRQFDYFYEEFWKELAETGQLEIDLAFSRDQTEKLYVQHRMHAKAKQLWSWLEEGAFLYVCGDAHRMAKDVEATLIQIIQEQGQMSEESAKAYLKSLRTQKRYLTDVY